MKFPSDRQHYTPRPTAAQHAMMKAEGREDVAITRVLDQRRAFLDALKVYAATADLALLGDFCRATRDEMALIYRARQR